MVAALVRSVRIWIMPVSIILGLIVVVSILLWAVSAGGAPGWASVLPAIGSLGVGAVMGSWVGHQLREEAEEKRARKELKGLLRLISMEIDLHEKLVLNECLPSPGFVELDKCRVLRTDTWEQTRVRSAQLLPVDRFTRLIEYYSGVQNFNVTLDENTRPKDKKYLLSQYGGGLVKQGHEIREWMKEDYSIYRND